MKADFRFGRLPATRKFLRLYKCLSKAETCYLNWIITQNDKYQPGICTLPIYDKTVAEAYDYKTVSIRDARLGLVNQGIITTRRVRKQTHICEIPSHWYYDDVDTKDNAKCSEVDDKKVVKYTTEPKSSSLQNANRQNATKTQQERLPCAAPTLPIDSFTAVLTASSSSSNMKCNSHNSSRHRTQEKNYNKAKGKTSNSKLQPTLELWHEYAGMRRNYDESKIRDVLSTIMNRYELDDIARADDLLRLAISDFLPSSGMNRLQYLAGITDTPQGIHAVDKAYSKLHPQAAQESNVNTTKGHTALAEKIEKPVVRQEPAPPPKRRSIYTKREATTHLSTHMDDERQKGILSHRKDLGEEECSD